MKEDEIIESRMALIMRMKIGETISVAEIVDPKKPIENAKEEIARVRSLLQGRLTSTIKYCQEITGNVYSREVISGFTQSGKLAVVLLIMRTS